MALGTQGDWLRPEVLAEPSRPAGIQPPAMFELRPLSLGEVLDRTFALYRARFWLFAGIAVISASMQVLVQAISLTTTHTLMRNIALGAPASGTADAQRAAFSSMAAGQAGTLIAGLVFFLVSAITQAATSLAMSEVYLNRPTGAKESLIRSLKYWYRWIAIALWQIWSTLWVALALCVPALICIGLGARTGGSALTVVGGALAAFAILAGIPAGFILYLRNSLALPAGVVERLGIRAAMRRSKVLSVGAKGRVFVVLLIAGCLLSVVGVLESPATMLVMFDPKHQHYIAQAITLLISFVGRTVVTPVAMIGLTLVYFDQRVRKEALDLQLLLETSAGGRSAAPAPGPPPTGATALG